MKAIILAAGVGKRLWEVTQHRPKCLIEIGGRSLLHRYLESLAAIGVRRADIVVGYKQEMIREAVAADSCGVGVTFLVNEEFHRGSISSLWIARSALDDDTIVMDADVLFHRDILRRLVSSACENSAWWSWPGGE
jgi:choline kinase